MIQEGHRCPLTREVAHHRVEADMALQQTEVETQTHWVVVYSNSRNEVDLDRVENSYLEYTFNKDIISNS